MSVPSASLKARAALKRDLSCLELARRHLRTVPLHRAIIRSMEARLFAEVECQRPILDIGCGDGHFAGTVFSEPLDAGVDLRPQELRQAAAGGAYRLVSRASGTHLPFRDESFACVMANCVIEHIPDNSAVLREVSRVLQAGGHFIFSVPSPRFAEYLLGSSLLATAGLRDLGGAYGRWFNRISRHYHCYGPSEWQGRLAEVGLSMDRFAYYGSPRSHRVFDLSHYYGAPTLLTHKLAGRWILAPWKERFWAPDWLLARLVASFCAERDLQDGAYVFFEAHKPGGALKGSSADAPHLPSHVE